MKTIALIAVGLFVGPFASYQLTGRAGARHKASDRLAPIVHTAVAHDVSRPLRSLVRSPESSEQQNASPTPTPPTMTSPPGAAAVEQTSQGRRAPARLVASFDGLGSGFKGPQGAGNWKVFETPVKSGQSSGIFSICFRDASHGVIVGGDYQKENEAVDNLAVTSDGGQTWKLVNGLTGFRSVVAYVPGTSMLVAIGPAGGDYSVDDGHTWTSITGPGFDTFSFARRGRVGWASGAGGAIGRLNF